MTRSLFLVIGLAALVAMFVIDGRPSAAADPETRARAVLTREHSKLGVPEGLTGIQTVDVRTGQAAKYVRFQQTIGGVPLVGADVIVGLSLTSSGDELVQSRYRPDVTALWPRSQITSAHALQIALAELGATRADLRGPPAAQRAFVANDDAATLTWQLTLPLSQPFGSWLVAVRAGDGQVISSTNFLRFDEGDVFNPNPAQSSGGSIPPPLDCDDPANEPLLSAEYVTMPLLGIEDGQGKLKGVYVDLTAPGIVGYKAAGQADELSREYSYACTDDRFEEVMVYYHLDSTQRKLQSLGFTGDAAILDRSIAVHPHYYAVCNAFFDPLNRALHFGDGGSCGYDADAAEDADVIVHEYGHAIQDDQVPGWGFGAALDAEQAWSMGEGFADFLAAAMYNDSCVADWFNFGGECLREIDSGNHYPEDFESCRPDPGEPAEEHCGGLIWSGALWDLAQALGGDDTAFDTALTLVLESHFMLSPVATFDEAATAIRQADDLLFGGAHGLTIDSVFAARGLSTAGGLSDFSYAYLRINHQRRGHLDVDLLVGSTTTPDCGIGVYGPVPGDNLADLVGYLVLEGSPCEPLLPPTAGQPWFLRVRDTKPGFTGAINNFDIVLNGSLRCFATDVPIPIPDDDGYVYSQVDCTTSVAGELSDDDGDGFAAAAELHVGTDVFQPCGAAGWPADVFAGTTENALDVQDLVSFLAPVRRFDTSPADAGFDVRWDIVPGPGVFSSWINIQDIVKLITLTPPMFGGERAFGQTCS